MTATALRLQGVVRRFGGVTALVGVDLTVRAGTLHALLGENGAGKSTLMHIIAGLLPPDAGEMEWSGARYVPSDPGAARAAGIGMVHQHFTTIPAFTVWENLALAAAWPLATARDVAARWLNERKIPLPIDTPASALSVGLRQQLELQKALVTEPRLLLLDEPTGVLTPPEVAELFRAIRAFTAQGGTVILITHKLDEALTQADAITVLRRGAVTLSWDGDATGPRPDRIALVRAMLETTTDAPPTRPPGVARGAVVARTGRLEIHAGEVIGVAGIEGNGQQALLRGLQASAFIPEDRTTEGLILDFTIVENLRLRSPMAGEGATIDWVAERQRAAAIVADYGVTTRSVEAIAGELSGGNQQKIVVARALEGSPSLVVAENPARGLDVGAAAGIFARLRRAAEGGAGVVFYSTDLDEVLTWADRVIVIADGILRVPPAGADRSAIAALMITAR